MKSYLTLSVAVHGMMLAGFVVVGTLLSKPRMSYYAVDLMSSSPAGGGSVSGPVAAPVSIPAPRVPKVVAPKVAPAAPRAAEEDLPDQDTIRMLAKLKKKRLSHIVSQPQAAEEPAASPQNAGHGGTGIPGSGAGIVGEAGTTFPYPWYMKSIADRLDKQWHPPQDFDPDTTCQVTFEIDRAGQISGSKLTKSSRDSAFDQFALRAVLYANPLPPLPNGYPEATLTVHMTFIGKRN